MSDWSKPKTRSSKLCNFPNDSSYLSEKIHSWKQICKGYCSELTQTIDRINRIIFENHSPEKIKVYEYQLDNTIFKLENITSELRHYETDAMEKENSLSFLNEQILRVSHIKAHLVNYFNSNSENIGKNKQSFPKSSSSLSKSSKGQSEKSHKSSISSHSESSKSRHYSSSHKSNSKGTEASNFAILDRRKTSDHAKLIADQEGKRANRKLKILKKTSELEKEKLENEKIKTQNKVIL